MRSPFNSISACLLLLVLIYGMATITSAVPIPMPRRSSEEPTGTLAPSQEGPAALIESGLANTRELDSSAANGSSMDTTNPKTSLAPASSCCNNKAPVNTETRIHPKILKYVVGMLHDDVAEHVYTGEKPNYHVDWNKKNKHNPI